MSKIVYKICTQQQWTAAVAAGEFAGAPVDVADGFIHFSAANQVAATAAKHFAGQTDLLLVSVDADQFGDRLKWEVSRGGDLFPHLYGVLPVAAATKVDPLVLNGHGQHVFPPEIV